MADGFFEPGKATSKTTQVASPAKRQAYLAALGALAKRDIGGYPGKAGKPPLELDLNALDEAPVRGLRNHDLNIVVTPVGTDVGLAVQA